MYLNMQPGDLALVYETKANPWRKKDGEWRRSPKPGKGCDVAAVELTSKILAINESHSTAHIKQLDTDSQKYLGLSQTQELEDDKLVNWLYVAKTRILKYGSDSSGCTLKESRRGLGKSSRLGIRLYDGIAQITAAQYQDAYDLI